MWSSTVQFSPLSNEGATSNPSFARCGGRFKEMDYSECSNPNPSISLNRGEANHMESEFEDHTLEFHLKCAGTSKNMRKSTACETELDFSGELSKEVSQKGNSPLGYEIKKPSLLQGLKCPAERKVFEDFVLDDEDDSPTTPIENLGKRTESAPTTMSDYEFPEKKFKVEEQLFSSLSAEQTCKFGHSLSQQPRDQDSSCCFTCNSQLSSIRKFAEENGGKLLSSSIENEIELQCSKGHLWTVSPRKAAKSWCKECKKNKKQILKDMIKEEQRRKEEELKDKQNKDLEDLRLKMMQGEQQAKKEELDTFKVIYDEITRIASKYAREYCQKDQQATFEQTLLLYQTLILPDKNLLIYLYFYASNLSRSLSKDDLKKEFRRYSILLHPDKNAHPKAKQAFQKAYGLFSSLISS